MGRANDAIEARLRHVRTWLVARADVKQYVIGPLVDRSHGRFDDFETIDERLPGA